MRLIFLLFVFASTISCSVNNGCKKLSLNKVELDWLDHYKNGELRLFKDQFGKIDTFQVAIDQEQFFTVCNRIELGDYIYGSKGVSFEAFNCRGQEKYLCEFRIYFSKANQKESDKYCHKQFSLFDLGSDQFDDFNLIDSRQDSLPLLKLKLRTYHFDLSENATDRNSGYPIIEYFDVCKEIGLVRYKTVKGEIYQFWKKA